MPNRFVQSYIETALWSSTDGDGAPLDDSKYSDAELASETLKRFEADCEQFQKQYLESMNKFLDYRPDDFTQEQLAHDFWLTRNHHGAGFWDGDYPKAIGDALTELAHSFSECDLYIGDDNKIHVG